MPSMPPSPPRKPRPGYALPLALIATALLAGCATPAPQAKRFLQHPEFPAAAQAAPNFTRQVLHALADAEARQK